MVRRKEKGLQGALSQLSRKERAKFSLGPLVQSALRKKKRKKKK